MELNSLTNTPGARERRKRVGRGCGSGMGKTSCKGQKGQQSRKGHKHKLVFEGGQMPLVRRLPSIRRDRRSSCRRQWLQRCGCGDHGRDAGEGRLLGQQEPEDQDPRHRRAHEEVHGQGSLLGLRQGEDREGGRFGCLTLWLSSLKRSRGSLPRFSFF